VSVFVLYYFILLLYDLAAFRIDHLRLVTRFF